MKIITSSNSGEMIKVEALAAPLNPNAPTLADDTAETNPNAPENSQQKSPAGKAIGGDKYAGLRDAIDKVLAQAFDKNPVIPSLCDVTDGSQRFCPSGSTIARIDMPNFVSTEDQNAFLQYLSQQGVTYSSPQIINPDDVKNTQSNVVTDKIAGWAKWNPSLPVEENIKNMGKPRTQDDPVLVSQDNYILDGHHRWAYAKVYNFLHDIEGSADFGPIIKINLPLKDLLKMASSAPSAAKKSDMDDVLRNSNDANIKYIVAQARKQNIQNAIIDNNNNYIVNGQVAGKLIEKAAESPNGKTGIFLTQELQGAQSQQPSQRAAKNENKIKIVKTASGKKTIKLSKREWQSIGKKAGWIKAAGTLDQLNLKGGLIEKVTSPQIANLPEGFAPINDPHVTLIGIKAVKPYEKQLKELLSNPQIAEQLKNVPDPQFGKQVIASRPDGKSSVVAEITNQQAFANYVNSLWQAIGQNNPEPGRFYHITLANNAGGVGFESIGDINQADFNKSPEQQMIDMQQAQAKRQEMLQQEAEAKRKAEEEKAAQAAEKQKKKEAEKQALIQAYESGGIEAVKALYPNLPEQAINGKLRGVGITV